MRVVYKKQRCMVHTRKKRYTNKLLMKYEKEILYNTFNIQ